MYSKHSEAGVHELFFQRDPKMFKGVPNLKVTVDDLKT